MARRSAKSWPIDSSYLCTWAGIADFLVTSFPGCEHETATRDVVRVAGKPLAYPAANERSRPSGAPANDEFVIIRIGLERREQLLDLNPEAFFVTPHYKTYSGVIVRLSTVDTDQLRDLLIESWRFVAPKRLVRDWDATHAP
jgi:hypothetical protein